MRLQNIFINIVLAEKLTQVTEVKTGEFLLFFFLYDLIIGKIFNNPLTFLYLHSTASVYLSSVVIQVEAIVDNIIYLFELSH
jgi:hypothetical protein